VRDGEERRRREYEKQQQALNGVPAARGRPRLGQLAARSLDPRGGSRL
jgi:hypothetical protein